MEVILKLFLRDVFFASGFGSSNWYYICVKTLSCDSLLVVTGVVLQRHAVVVAVAVGGDDCKVVACVVGSGFGSNFFQLVLCLCQNVRL